MITPEQLRAARAILKWGQDELAEKSGVSAPAIANIEKEKTRPNTETARKLLETLENAGIELLDGGARTSQDLIKIYEGPDCYLRLLDDAFISLADKKGEILFSASDERRSPPIVIEKFRAMRKCGIHMRSLVKDKDTYLMGLLNEYRWMNERLFVDGDVKVIYDNKVSYLMSWKGVPRVITIKDDTIADENRRIFDFLWDISAKPTHTTSDIFYESKE